MTKTPADWTFENIPEKLRNRPRRQTFKSPGAVTMGGQRTLGRINAPDNRMKLLAPERLQSSDSIACPTCERDDFASTHGLFANHHPHVHGEKLRIAVTCAWCGETTPVTPNRWERNDRHFCDEDCEVAWRRDGGHAGENNPSWKGRYEYTCAWCGTTDTRPQWMNQDRENEFCSYDCYHEWLRENLSIERRFRGAAWEQARQDALEAAGYECRICAMSNETHVERYGCELHVHHVVPDSAYDDAEAAHSQENLVVLCNRHHGKWEGVPVVPEGVGQ